MINILRSLKLAKTNQPMKQFLLFFFTASFLFLGSVNADNTKIPAKKYGPVKSGQTLWGIAYKTRPKGISRLEMMDALHKLNPSAFDKGNINRLKKGAMLTLPLNKEMVIKVLTGDEVQIATEEDDSNKDIDTLRTELSSVKEQLAKSKEALKGLNVQSEQLQQAKQSVEALAKENEALKNGSDTLSDKAKEELTSAAKKYAEAQTQIKQLEEEKVELQAQADQSEKEANQDGDNEKTLKELATVNAELVTSKDLIKELAEKNKQLQTDSIDPKLLETAKQELANTSEELDALKVQNQLLREQAVSADVTDQERKDNNRKFSETIAALNSDIGQLRTRIKELEELEKMKDGHISQLQKSLDHATVVIKEQAEVNKKMYTRLNEFEKADNIKEEQEEEKAAAAITNSNPSNPTPPAEPSALVNFADKPETGSSIAVSETMKHISPKFWLLLTLAGLLFVLALLWRVISGKDEPEAIA